MASASAVRVLPRRISRRRTAGTSLARPPLSRKVIVGPERRGVSSDTIITIVTRPTHGVLSVPVRFQLYEVLEKHEVSQTELSRLSGVSLVTINAMKQNRTKQVSLLTLDKICSSLRCEPGKLLTRKPAKRRLG
jgi:putative transcriptional regulator